MHAEYATRHFASEFPHLAVTTRFIGRYEAGGTSQRGLIGAKVANGTGCQVLIGPGSSGIAVAMNPLVDEYWMDYSATSTELSSRFNFPLFSRVVPTDADATSGWAPLLRELQWSAFGIVCTNTAYGRSVSAGLAAVLQDIASTGTSPECVLVEAGEAAADAELARIRREGHRLVAVAMATTDPFFEALVAAILRSRAYEHIVFLFCESACSSTIHSWKRVPGALCGTFAINPETMGPFLVSYAARNVSSARAAYAAMGWPLDSFSFTDATGVYPAYATDATRFTLRALDAYVAERGQLPESVEAGTAYIRNFTMPGGASGTVQLSDGNRAAADMVIFNSAADGQTVRVVANSSATGSISIAPELSLFGRDGYTLATIPPIHAPGNQRGSSGTLSLIIIVVGVAVVVVSVAAVGGVVVSRCDQRGPTFKHCPLDDSEPFAVLFVGLANEAALNDAYTETSVRDGIAATAKAVRGAVRESMCHEAQRVDDGTFMIVAKSPERALQCAAAISAAVHGHGPGKGVNAPFAPAAAAAFHDTTSETRSNRSLRSNRSGMVGAKRSPQTRALATNGLDCGASNSSAAGYRPTVSVTLGVAYGFGTIEHDEAHNVLSYRGPVLNAAASATDAGVAGQIVATERLVDAVVEENLDVVGTFDQYMDAPGDAQQQQQGPASPGTMHTFVPSGQPSTLTERVRLLIWRKQEARQGTQKKQRPDGDGEQSVSIAASLARAETGVAPRRCAVAAVAIKALFPSSAFSESGQAHTKHATATVRAVIAAASRHKCHVHDIVGTSVIVTANALGPAVTAAPLRVAQFAREVVESTAVHSETVDPSALRDRHTVTVGLAAGSVMAAGCIDGTSIVGGALASQARLAQAAGLALELPVVLALPGTAQHESDIDSHYVLVPVDAASTSPARTANHPRGGRTTLLCAVGHEREHTDEWLYAFDRSRGPDALQCEPATWVSFLDGELPQLADWPERPGSAQSGCQAVSCEVASEPMPSIPGQSSDTTTEHATTDSQPAATAAVAAATVEPPIANEDCLDAALLRRSVGIGQTRLDAARRECGSAPSNYPTLRALELVGALAST